MRRLISLPPAMSRFFGTCREGLGWHAACDPAGAKLGSGGGVAHLLASAWKADGRATTFEQWCDSDLHLAMMAGGQSRRLPAYAATGKILMPFPILRWADGQRIDQTLLDVQWGGLEHIAERAPVSSRLLIASGDVLLRFPEGLPPLPDADIVALGMWVDAHTASHFGVFFTRREAPESIEFFLQKPPEHRISELASTHLFLVDTGLWLLSQRAIALLMEKCGWHADRQDFQGGVPSFYELYAGLGPCLGAHPFENDPQIAALTSAVAPVPGAEFHHFGTSRQMIESVSALQNRSLDQRSQSPLALKPHPDMYVLNSDFEFAKRSPTTCPVWVENSSLPAELPLAGKNVVTNVPGWLGYFELPPGVCIDMPPVGTDSHCLRVYGFDDAFKGPVGAPETTFLGQPAPDWFAARNLSPSECGIDPSTDIQCARLFPLVRPGEAAGNLLAWMTTPNGDAEALAMWLRSERLSAEEITDRFCPERLWKARDAHVRHASLRLFEHRARNPFHRLDLESAGGFFEPGELPGEPQGDVLERTSELVFRSRLVPDIQRKTTLEREAFSILADSLISASCANLQSPVVRIQSDQIVWGRSPVRIDLAGGWTDTAPYCLRHGGAVVNMAVDLNGQPPVQVFARTNNRRDIVIRSIDLGEETRIETFEELGDFELVGGAFSLAKAALALAGFHPRFSGHSKTSSLSGLLAEFGGGLEISLLAATPKGSGLGTSSILGATILGTLSDLCGLGWDEKDIIARTVALEQLLTTGGGWQDQVGGLYRGFKLAETGPGLSQHALVRWLPEHLLQSAMTEGTLLLYYTGHTRVARGILQDIVRGMFLQKSATLRLLGEMQSHARESFVALQSAKPDALAAMVRRTWEQNCALDAGTNPPEVQSILSRIADWTAAAKLPGAGGGGYLFIVAKDPRAAAHIRTELTNHPPNMRARFVRMNVSQTGLQVTRS